MDKPKVIAFYLPQFYPTQENDIWWEPGFTEWTNVAKAKPLFKGHYQPRIPQELSFYDLRIPEVREKQAKLAQEAGIYGFCYWHYWFGNGKRLLSEVFKEVVESGKPDFPFCLCWANHSWYQKTWHPDKPDKLLIEQRYLGKQDYIDHFFEMLPAFKDKRYIRTSDGRLLFGIFSPSTFSAINDFMDIWNHLAKENGLVGFEFFAFVQGNERLEKLLSTDYRYDCIVYDALTDVFKPVGHFSLKRIVNYLKRKLGIPPKLADYGAYVDSAIKSFHTFPEYIPCIDPMFDHSPRSSNRGVILHNNNPKKWGLLCQKVIDLVSTRNLKDKFIFIKAWNEWGEGNYMEPDRKFGKGYIKEAAKAFK